MVFSAAPSVELVETRSRRGLWLFFHSNWSDKGKFVSFNEIADGGALDGGVGLEMGRVDYLGNPMDFRAKYLFGGREKFSGSMNQGIFSAGGAYSKSEYDGIGVLSTSIKLGFGLSPSLLFLVGYNLGVIKP